MMVIITEVANSICPKVLTGKRAKTQIWFSLHLDADSCSTTSLVSILHTHLTPWTSNIDSKHHILSWKMKTRNPLPSSDLTSCQPWTTQFLGKKMSMSSQSLTLILVSSYNNFEIITCRFFNFLGTVNTENGYEVSDYFSVVQENKPHKFKDADGKEQKTDCYYYPGFIFNFSIIRDPWPKIQRAFLPSIILGIFLYCTFDLTG